MLKRTRVFRLALILLIKAGKGCCCLLNGMHLSRAEVKYFLHQSDAIALESLMSCRSRALASNCRNSIFKTCSVWVLEVIAHQYKRLLHNFFKEVVSLKSESLSITLYDSHSALTVNTSYKMLVYLVDFMVSNG